MDKYEFNLKIEQLKKLIDREDYVTALKITQSIDWNRVRNTNILTLAATVYEKNDLLQEAKDMLILAFERAPVGKHLLYKLTELSCRTGDLDEAEDYYREYRAIDATDTGNYLLQYMILKAGHAPYERQQLPLERYCETDPDERWLYELACSYEYSHRIEDCVRTCDRIALLYGASTYGIKALRLKARYMELTDTQQNMLYPRTVPEDEISYEEQDYSGLAGGGQISAEYGDEAGMDADSADTAFRNYNTGHGGDMTGIYDDRSYERQSGTEPEQTMQVYDEEEEARLREEEAARQSDELARERYADEDEAFNAYVLAHAGEATREAVEIGGEAEGTDTGDLDGGSIRDAAGAGKAAVGVVSGRPAGARRPQDETGIADYTGDDDEGAQLAFNFESGAPKVVQEKEDINEAAGSAAELAGNPVQAAAAAAEATAAGVAGLGTGAAVAGAVTEAASGAAAPAKPTAPAESIAPSATAAPTVTAAPAETEKLSMIVESESAGEGLAIAIDELKNIHDRKGIEQPSVKTQASKLNDNGITEGILAKVRGKDFVIESAGSLTPENLNIIYKFITGDDSGSIVVLIDTPDGLDKIESVRPELFDVCDYISDVEDNGGTAAGAVSTAAAANTAAAVENKNSAAPGADNRPALKAQPAPAAAQYDQGGLDEPYDDDRADDVDEDDTDGGTADEGAYADDGAGSGEPERKPVKRSVKTQSKSERFYNIKEVSPDRADHQMDIDDFAQYCAQYAAEIDCSITGTSMLALYERIELMEEDGIPLTKTNAAQLIEEAADRAEKPPIGKRLKNLFRSRYDKNGLLILNEDDFIY